MAGVRSPNLSASSPPSNYKGVGTLLKHWGTSETSTLDAKQIKICEDSGLDSLLHLIRMPHVKVQGLAMSVINSLREGENGDIHIDSEDGFRPLVDLAKFAEEDVQREAVWSLAILASNSSCQARIEQEVGWHNFRKYAASEVPEIQAGTAILLGNLALEKRNQENLMVKGVPLLLNMLRDTKDAKVRRAVVTALSNVSIIENYGAKDVWLDMGIELMMPYIEQSEDMQLQIGALNTVANVCNHDQANELKKKVGQLGGIARLVPLLDSSEEMVVKLAAMTIANMASEESHRSIMHGLKVEEPLVRLLDSRDEEVQLGVSMAINALAEHEPARQEFRARHAAEPLKELIQVSKDSDILKEAKAALKKISPEDFDKLKLSLSASNSSSYSEDSDDESYTSTSYDSDEAKQKGPKRSRTESAASHSSMSESDSDSDSDSSGSEITGRGRAGSSFLVRQQHEAKRLEEERKFREEQERRRIQEEEEEQEEKKREAAAKAEEASRDRSLSGSVADVGGNNKENNRKSVNLTEEEVRLRRSEAARKREKEEEEAQEKKKEEEKKIEEEKRFKRPEGKRIVRDDSSSTDEDDDDDKSRSSKSGSSDSEEQIPEEERRRREEETRRKKEEDEKIAIAKAEEARKMREEVERIRESQEKEFGRREEVGKINREELENSDTSSHTSRGSRRGRREGSRRTSLGSVGSVGIPKHPAKALVILLRDAKHKKMIEKDAWRELDRYAHKRERDQVQHGEDIIGILVYIIYFYPDAEYPDIIILSLYLLALLARYSVRNQLAVRRAKGGEQIITLLQSGVEYVRRNAALALGAYTLNNKNIQGEVTRSIAVLSRILEAEQTPPATRRTVAACLAAIADNHALNQSQVMTSGALRATINMIPADKLFVRSGLNLVAASVSHNVNAQNQILLEFPRFLTDLMGMLASAENAEYYDSIVNTLVELSKKNPRVQLGIYHADGLARLVPLLSGYQNEDDLKKMQLCVNVLYLLLTQIKLTKHARKVREDLVGLRVVSTIQPMCAAKSRLLAETALNLTKAIEARN